MSTHKHIDRICVIVTAIAVLFTVLFMNGEALGVQTIVDEDAEEYEGTENFTANDLNGTWYQSGTTDDGLISDATVITLDGDDASISGSGAYAYDGNVYISNAGRYLVSGELSDGSIVVDAYKSSKIWILFNGVTIHCSDDAGFIVSQAQKVFLTLADGTENEIVSSDISSEEALADKRNAAIFARDDLTINGGGTLAVTGDYKHGITAKDDLKITGGTLTIVAPQDGIHVNDSFRLTDADVTITVGDDGIHSDTDILLAGGTLLIDECYEGIEAIVIEMTGGDVTIYPSDDGFNANGGSGDAFGMGGGMQGGGMQGGGGMRGGDMANASGDASSGGAMQMPPMNDDANSGGAMRMPPDNGESSENANADESAQTTDAKNTDSENATETNISKATADSETESDEEEEETYIKISGGTLTIINETGQDADGLDSNGDIYISGGDIRISLANTGSNSAIDYASESSGVCEITGGTVIAAGSYSMAEQFDTTSKQCSILYTYSTGAEAGTAFALEDADGNVLIDWDVPCSFSSINVSCPEMAVGETYLVVIGDNVEEITLEEVSASYGDAQSGGFGGTMNFGGMKSRGDFQPNGDGGGFTPPDNADGDSESGNASGDASSDGRPALPDGISGGMMRGAPPDMQGNMGQNGETEQSDNSDAAAGETGDAENSSSDAAGNAEQSTMPQMPNGAEQGDNSDATNNDTDAASGDTTQNEMPQMPENMEQNGDATSGGAMQGGMPQDMQGGDMQNGDRNGAEDADETEDTTDTAVSITELDTEVWLWLGASVLALIAGLLFAYLYHKGRL